MTNKRMPFYIVGMIVGGGFLLYAGVAVNLEKGEWASWAQAVFSVIAIIAAVEISNSQLAKQQEAAKADAVAESARMLTFADAVVKNALEVMIDVEDHQRDWSRDTPYVYHDAPQVEASLEVLRTLMLQALPLGMVKPTILIHKALLAVDMASKQLVGVAHFAANSRFDLVWTKRKNEVKRVERDVHKAVEEFNVAHPRNRIDGAV